MAERITQKRAVAMTSPDDSYAIDFTTDWMGHEDAVERAAEALREKGVYTIIQSREITTDGDEVTADDLG